MKAYRLEFSDNSFSFVIAKDDRDVVRKYNLATREHINTRIIELEGEQKAIAFSNLQ